MTYEEIMSITPGSIVPGGCSVNPNATYMGCYLYGTWRINFRF